MSLVPAIMTQEDIDKAKDLVAEDLRTEVVSFLDNNASNLLGLAVSTVKATIEAADNDSEYGEAQITVYRAMNPTERDAFMRSSLGALRNARTIVVRQAVILRDAREELASTARKFLTGFLGTLLA